MAVLSSGGQVSVPGVCGADSAGSSPFWFPWLVERRFVQSCSCSYSPGLLGPVAVGLVVWYGSAGNLGSRLLGATSRTAPAFLRGGSGVADRLPAFLHSSWEALLHPAVSLVGDTLTVAEAVSVLFFSDF